MEVLRRVQETLTEFNKSTKWRIYTENYERTRENSDMSERGVKKESDFKERGER